MKYFLEYLNEYFDLLFLSVSLLLLIFVASRIDKTNKRILASIAVSVIILSIFEYVETLFGQEYYDTENFPRYLFSCLAYILRPTVIVLFFHIRMRFKEKKEAFVWLLSGVNLIIYVLALFAYKNPSMRFVFWYDENNSFNRGWLGFTVYAVCAVYLVSLIIISIMETVKKHERIQLNFVVITSVIIAVIAQILSMVLDLKLSYTSDAYIIGALLYFMYLSYDSAYKEAMNHEKEMQEKTTALMLSQIQPHFVYNTLATIQALCDTDPELASKTITDFSKYLRVNTDALSKTEPVDILDEINHAKAYAKIEMLRFDNVEVNFDIQDEGFKVPVLTIQPLVENAIKYGVRAKEKGIVEVKTYLENQMHMLVISDNGIGFDKNTIGADGKIHVGINNVQTRIINMVNGTFNVESVIGEGTTITIQIPEVK